MSNQETAKTRAALKSFLDFFGRLFARSVFLRRRRSQSGPRLPRTNTTFRLISERSRRCFVAFLLVVFAVPSIFGNLLHQHEPSEHCYERAESASFSFAVLDTEQTATDDETSPPFLVVGCGDEKNASNCPICRFFSHCQSFVFIFSANVLDDATLKIAPTPSQVLSSTTVLIRRGRAPPRTFCR